MIAFDTDVLTEILLGNTHLADRAARIAVSEQSVPIVVIEEILRGRLNAIRQAEAGKARISISRAYEYFRKSVADFQRLRILGYSAIAESLFRQWRRENVRVSTHDLRIAAICVSQSATLVSRNRRDFERVPELSVEYWD